MNTERLFENASEALRLACISVHKGDEHDGTELYKMMVKDPELYLHASDRIYWYEALPALEIYAMAKDELGKAKSGTAYSAFKRVIKRNGNILKNLAGVWTDSEGRSCVCDGYIAIRMRSPVDGFESVPGIDLEKLWVKDSDLVAELTVPSPGEVKINKKKLTNGKAVYDFGDELPMVDVKLLKDVMDCLPDARAYITDRGTTSPIIFKSDKGDAILLPIRKRDVA